MKKNLFGFSLSCWNQIICSIQVHFASNTSTAEDQEKSLSRANWREEIETDNARPHNCEATVQPLPHTFLDFLFEQAQQKLHSNSLWYLFTYEETLHKDTDNDTDAQKKQEAF